MSCNYESVQIAALYPDAFGVAAPASPVGQQVWPRQPGVFIRLGAAPNQAQAEEAAHADQSSRELSVGEQVKRWSALFEH